MWGVVTFELGILSVDSSKPSTDVLKLSGFNIDGVLAMHKC